MDENYNRIINAQQTFFKTGTTLPVSFRIEQLKKLKTIIESNEENIAQALKKDLHKAPAEASINEIVLVIREINFIIKHLRNWMKPERVQTPFALRPGVSHIYAEPYGCVLILSPWNFPFMLTFSPLVGAISAGNCVILKPSEVSTHSQNLIIDLIQSHFPSEYITAIKANPDETNQLLEEKFDFIFFTGGSNIGKKVIEASAKHLTPVVLELGGKSPCIVDESANLSFAAKRILWAKLNNAGQTCIAPDYVYVHESKKNTLIQELLNTLKHFYGEHPDINVHYGKIINQKHLERLKHLLSNGNIIVGGKINDEERYFAPTIIDQVTWQDPIMQEEIFGPLLPILTFSHLDEVINVIRAQPKPLALYLFTHNKQNETRVMSELSFGGGCVNDCMMQIVNLHLPFGGVGRSGMGAYHGYHSFQTFSHRKSIFKKTRLIDLGLEYPPFTKKKLAWLRWLLNMSA